MYVLRMESMTKEESYQDIALSPNHNADSEDEIKSHINSKVFGLYDIYSYRHAAAILRTFFRSIK